MTDKTDEWYLRRGVELADGWELEGDEMFLQVTMLSGDKYNVFGCHVTDPFPPATDALAAELVRQVDALDDREYELDLSRDEVWLGYTDSYEGIVRIAKVRGPDRTINTIKAIVDFAEANPGVLGA